MSRRGSSIQLKRLLSREPCALLLIVLLGVAGQLLHTLTLPTTIRTLAFAGVSQRLWVATTRGVRAYDEQGALVSTLSLGTNPTVHTVAVTEASGAVWVALAQRLRRYAASGQQDLDLPLSARRVTSDGDGGVWLTTATRVQRRAATGQSLVNVALPTSGDDDDESSGVVDLAADPVDHTLWLAQGSTLRHYRFTGQVLQSRTFGSARLRAVVLYTDLLPPTLVFTTPPALDCGRTRDARID